MSSLPLSLSLSPSTALSFHLSRANYQHACLQAGGDIGGNSNTNYDSMPLEELRSLLRSRALSASGNRRVLIDRLLAFDAEAKVTTPHRIRLHNQQDKISSLPQVDNQQTRFTIGQCS
jgi:hypothetical protein